MATHLTEGDKGEYLSAAALSLYGAIARQEWGSANELQATHPGVLEELTSWGLITTSEDRLVACDPGKALQRKLEEELEVARRLPSLARELYRDYKAAQLRTPGGSSVYMSDPAVVNTRIREVVGDARREILAAQPGGPRSRELLEIAVARDMAALDRGVDLRTIYRDTVRDDAVTAEYARTMSARTSGRPAQYRTLFGEFERMIIVDREYAFVSDYIVEGSPPHSAWLITDPAAVAVLARAFESAWRWAQPWMGELRPSRGASGPDTVTSADGVRTSPRQREIMRLLCSGVSQGSIAKKLGCAKRTLEADIAALKALWGVTTLNEVIFHFASSPDCLVDDGTPAAADSPATESAA